MKTSKIGIADYDQMKARTMAIAGGEHAPPAGWAGATKMDATPLRMSPPGGGGGRLVDDTPSLWTIPQLPPVLRPPGTRGHAACGVDGIRVDGDGLFFGCSLPPKGTHR